MNSRKFNARTAACALLLASAITGGANAQDGKDRDDDEATVAKACLDHNTIRRTRILGDRNIAFVTKRNEIYNNQLPRQCPSLNRNSLVNYAVANRELCAGSIFQVLWQTGLGNYTPAFTCQLGAFVPITEDELETLAAVNNEDSDRRRPRRRSSQEAVTTEQVELPPRAEAAPEAATPPAPQQ
ncbi:MAG TPA: hypothetical protein VM692_14095 [Gammaproteobacteria bacterium]|nr:hypothetical protein [Gammaproteobacteria bacterium]